MAQFSMAQKYDSLKGRPIREIKSNNIVHISAPLGQYSAGTVAFTALSSTSELYITGFGYSAKTATDFYVTVDTSTILPTYLAADGHVERVTNINAPLFKADASSTISIAIGSAGSITAWLCGVVHPTFEKVETA